MALGVIGVRPPRCTLVNLTSEEELACLANPAELRERVGVSWNRLSVAGLSHQVLQYGSTENRQIQGLELVIDRYLAMEEPTAPDILEFRRFLLALTVPPAVAAGAPPAAPPRVLFVWPGLLTLECVVDSVEFAYQRFATDGTVLVYTATVALQQVLDVRVTSDELRRSS